MTIKRMFELWFASIYSIADGPFVLDGASTPTNVLYWDKDVQAKYRAFRAGYEWCRRNKL
jgi:hypothetical protein